VSFDRVHQLRRFVLQFRAMLRWRNANKLCTWIEAATASHFRFLAQFANTLRRDLLAKSPSYRDIFDTRNTVAGHAPYEKLAKATRSLVA
jgi:nitrate reductase assembly molybdenum cofactor insertion protein NarJ